MNFLLKYQFTKDDLFLFQKYNDKEVLENFKMIQSHVCSILDYFIDYGIVNVKEILFNKIEVFFQSKEDLEALFSKYERESLIESIMKDVNVLSVL